ncbi:MAG: phage tail assembly protein [Gammaproteobacteria bacterium]|nr:phage tail assembly protein [Gammaproteobacteria bacterium]
MDITVKLSRPIQAHNEELSQLTLREPTGEDVERLGIPATMGADESLSMNGKVICAYIVRLGKIPRTSVQQMAPADITACWTELLPFFFPSSSDGEEIEELSAE